MKTSVMLDLETFGKRPGCVVRAVGAVKFGGGQILDRFYHRIDGQSCADIGLTMDVSTVEWWLGQSEEARREMTLPGQPVAFVAEAFSVWLADPEAEIWGNGATFDNAIWVAVYDALRMRTPWKFSNDRCYRTMKNQFPKIPFNRGSGTHHNALDDATAQANHLMAIHASLI